MEAMLQVESCESGAVAELLEDGRDHHRAEADGITGDDKEDELESERSTHEAIVERGVRDGRGILASDQVEHKIERREDKDAPDKSDPEKNFGEFHSDLSR